MNTIAKYREAVAGHFRRTRGRVYGCLAVGLVLYGLGWAAVKRLGSAGLLPDWILAAIMASLPACAFAILGVAAWSNERRRLDDPRLVCPHCDGPLQLYAPIVITTRNCPHCGRRVLAD
jgi:hypothetical protein